MMSSALKGLFEASLSTSALSAMELPGFSKHFLSYTIAQGGVDEHDRIVGVAHVTQVTDNVLPDAI